MTDTFPVTVKTYHKVDGSVTFTAISDSEVSKAQYGQIQERWNRETAIMTLSPPPVGGQDAPGEEAPETSGGGIAAAESKRKATPSQLLRLAIQNYWEAAGSNGDFEGYYQLQMHDLTMLWRRRLGELTGANDQ